MENSNNSDKLMGAFPFIQNRLVTFNEFEKWFKRIESFEDDNINILLNLIPSSWNLSNEEKYVLFNFIKSRKYLIRGIITKNKKGLNIGT